MDKRKSFSGNAEQRQRLADKQYNACGFLYRKFNGNLKKVSDAVGLSVPTLEGRIRGDRRQFLLGKGPLNEKEEKELESILQELKILAKKDAK